MKHHP